MDTFEKIRDLADARELATQARHLGKRVVLANGCFDILHVGHVRYLNGARARGDLLFVGVNSDASVRRLKGEGRPILDQQARARLVAALECVDCVVIFEEPDVNRLLHELKPDVHAKGTDYTADTVPERAAMRELGGEVAIVGDEKQHSTRDLIQHILRKCQAE